MCGKKRGSMSARAAREKKNRRLAVVFLVIVTFFWYLASYQIYYRAFNDLGFTMSNTLFQTTLGVISLLVYTYLIYELIKIEKFNLRNSLLLTYGMIVLAIVCIVVFPLPL